MPLAADDVDCYGWSKLLHWPGFSLIFHSFRYALARHRSQNTHCLCAQTPGVLMSLGGVRLPLTGLRALTDPNTLFQRRWHIFTEDGIQAFVSLSVLNEKWSNRRTSVCHCILFCLTAWNRFRRMCLNDAAADAIFYILQRTVDQNTSVRLSKGC